MSDMTSDLDTNRDKVLRREVVKVSDVRLLEMQAQAIALEGVGDYEYHWHWAAIVNELIAQRAEVGQLRAALKVARQAILEFSHAQECGPKWYTRGEDGMYRQVHMWLRKGLNAVREALGPYDDSGQFLKEIPEKGASEPNAL